MKGQGAASRDSWLAPYAMRSADSRGRKHSEAEHGFRVAFQRDRDRIIHSSAFRRLEYKTQVFVNHEGDYYRTRLTHTMETAQVARTIARTLRINEDLAEAVALAHDLGHTPFGHAGERALNELMGPYGGFEHNAQSLRIVEVLEERYPEFPGLNLTWEVREGIVKHSPPYDKPLAQRFAPGQAPSLEAQIVDYADEIAYNSHDIDDGLQAALITAEALDEVPLWAEIAREIDDRCPRATASVRRYQAIRCLIDRLVTNLIDTVRTRVEAESIDSVPAIRRRSKPLVGFSEEMEAKRLELKDFLLSELYRHRRVMRSMLKAQRVLRALFHTYMEDPIQLPPHFLARQTAGTESPARVVADYIAGMTDRFAFEEYRQLFDAREGF